MGYLKADWIPELVAEDPLRTDPRSQGDDHLRNLNRVLKKTFPKFVDKDPVNATAAELSACKGHIPLYGPFQQQILAISGANSYEGILPALSKVLFANDYGEKFDQWWDVADTTDIRMVVVSKFHSVHDTTFPGEPGQMPGEGGFDTPGSFRPAINYGGRHLAAAGSLHVPDHDSPPSSSEFKPKYKLFHLFVKKEINIDDEGNPI